MDKNDYIRNILAQEAYSPSSGIYKNLAAALSRLSLDNLRNLNLFLIFKVTESNELDRKVQKILGR